MFGSLSDHKTAPASMAKPHAKQQQQKSVSHTDVWLDIVEPDERTKVKFEATTAAAPPPQVIKAPSALQSAIRMIVAERSKPRVLPTFDSVIRIIDIDRSSTLDSDLIYWTGRSRLPNDINPMHLIAEAYRTMDRSHCPVAPRIVSSDAILCLLSDAYGSTEWYRDTDTLGALGHTEDTLLQVDAVCAMMCGCNYYHLNHPDLAERRYYVADVLRHHMKLLATTAVTALRKAIAHNKGLREAVDDAHRGKQIVLRGKDVLLCDYIIVHPSEPVARYYSGKAELQFTGEVALLDRLTPASTAATAATLTVTDTITITVTPAAT